MKLMHALLAAAGLTAVSTASAMAGTITIATVNNGHMITMQKLTSKFTEANPDIKVNWVTLDEGTLRTRVTTDIASKGGQFDITTIGMYEAPTWGKNGWLLPLHFTDAYDVNDIYPAIRGGLSYNDTLYAAPFYGESSMIMYRKDLVQAAGMTIDDNPTWDHIKDVAAAITNKDKGIYGICLRGKPGWGENMGFLVTLANSFGGQLFNIDWTPAFNSDAWLKAVNFYLDIMKYAPPGSESNSFNEILALMNQGKCGMWVDATIAASFVTDPSQSTVADKIAFAQAPYEVTKKGANWLWAWALAIPASSKNPKDAQKFIEWATSKDYINLVGKEIGWGNIPTGTRQSTYSNPEFLKAASFAKAELAAILSADPKDKTLKPAPYTGIQFATIPEWQVIGNAIGQEMTAALTGQITADAALKNAQDIADREMRKAGYY